MKPEMILMIDYGQLQHWLKSSGSLKGKRTPSWAIAQALLLYHKGLSLRKVAAELTARGIPHSHDAVWGMDSAGAGGYPYLGHPGGLAQKDRGGLDPWGPNAQRVDQIANTDVMFRCDLLGQTPDCNVANELLF